MPTLPQATTGALAGKSLAQILARALDAELTGSLVVTRPSGVEAATIVFSRGEIAKIRTDAPVAYLGMVLYELGVLSSAELDASLRDLAERKVPHGLVLLEREAITRKELADGLREQTLRKLLHLFTLDEGSDGSTYAWNSGVDLLPGYGGRDVVLVDPLPAIRIGLMDVAKSEDVNAVLSRLGSARFKIGVGAHVGRLGLSLEELAVADALRIKAMTLDEARALGAIDRRRVDRLVYCLLLTKQLTVIEKPVHAPLSERPSHYNPPRAPGAYAPLGATPDARPRRDSWTGSGTRPRVRPEEHEARERAIVVRASSIGSEDYFERLSVPRDASQAQIDHAFDSLASLWSVKDLPAELDHVRLDCERVLGALMEAHSTLSDPRRRAAYVRQILLAPQHGAAKDLAASGAENELDGALACLERNDLERATRLAQRAHKARPNDAKALALLAWIESRAPANQTPEATRVRLAMLDRAIAADPDDARAYYYRSQLHKRLSNHRAAMRDLARVVALDPNDIEADRELRIYEMRLRHGSLRMEAARKETPATGTKTEGAKPAPRGFFGKLFKR